MSAFRPTGFLLFLGSVLCLQSCAGVVTVAEPSIQIDSGPRGIAFTFGTMSGVPQRSGETPEWIRAMIFEPAGFAPGSQSLERDFQGMPLMNSLFTSGYDWIGVLDGTTADLFTLEATDIFDTAKAASESSHAVASIDALASTRP